MQTITSGIEESSLPKSIVRIEVEKLFGKYTYTLSISDDKLVDSLIILYGDNGCGKTTILKLLFHLLSPVNTSGHLSFVTKTYFRQFSVVLADGTTITATRRDGTLVGSFEVKLIKNNNIFTQNIKDNQEEQANIFYKHLSELQLNLFFLGDSRNLNSDIFEDEEYLKDRCNILITFEKMINNLYFVDKYIKLHVQDGLKIFTKQGEELSVEVLSSGEKQLLLLFCHTLVARDKAAIFIIDEPEISLNIKCQRQLIRSLLELTKGSQVQFIFATHSIELLSQYKNHVIKLQSGAYIQ